MSDAVKLALIGITGIFIVNVAAVVMCWLTHRKLTVVAHEMNSVRDALVAKTDKEAYARGRKDQKETKK